MQFVINYNMQNNYINNYNIIKTNKMNLLKDYHLKNYKKQNKNRKMYEMYEMHTILDNILMSYLYVLNMCITVKLKVLFIIIKLIF